MDALEGPRHCDARGKERRFTHAVERGPTLEPNGKAGPGARGVGRRRRVHTHTHTHTHPGRERER